MIIALRKEYRSHKHFYVFIILKRIDLSSTETCAIKEPKLLLLLLLLYIFFKVMSHRLNSPN